MKKVICIIFILLLISTTLISSFYLYNELKEDNKQEKIFENLLDIAETKESEKQDENGENSININELYKENNDIVGWLEIEDTNINYPIMQTKHSPNYYLRRNFYKEYSIMGTPYLAEQCDLNKSDNLIIYGHNISGNKMFADLEKYKKESFYKEHKTIKFYTKEEKTEYEIIAVFKTVAEKGFKYYNYYDLDKSEFDTFIAKCKELAFYNINLSANYGDKLITLSTCEYSQTNGRLVVVAKKIL